MRRHIADRLWIVAIVLGWLWIGWPAWFWFEVGRVHVHDAVVGEAPRMQVERTIRRPFHADWLVTVMRVEANGARVTHCTSLPGSNDYLPENALPPDLTLDWWFGPRRCRLSEGRYLVNTVWTIRPTWTLPRTVRAQSNVFEVRASQ